MQDRIDTLANVIWEYHLMHHTVIPADCILALGSNDIRVADRAIDIFHKGFAPSIIFSGGLGELTRDLFCKPEADVFADRARERGIPEEKILIENKSTNTGENILFTQRLLAEQNVNPDSFIVIQKPYMERRTYATFRKRWAEKTFLVTSPQISYEEYPNNTISKELLINIMVGDLQRIREYPNKGYQIYQEIPENVWHAYEELTHIGYTKHLIKV